MQRFEGLSLSFERAVQNAPLGYADAYRWFIAHEGAIGPRPYGKHEPEGLTIKIAAQRGIHKPHNMPYAISITSSGGSFYANDEVSKLSDGTWVMRYCAHQQNEGSEKSDSLTYNTALIRCLDKGLPVGAFQKVKAGKYLCLGLAFVEKFDPTTALFWLHGPVRENQPADLFSPVSQDEIEQIKREIKHDVDPSGAVILAEIDTSISTEDERDRVLAEVVRRKQQENFRDQLLDAYDGRCAISDYDVPQALQAAHICSYLGRKSQIVTNGLLLRADLHILYDRSLLSVNPDTMKVELADSIKNSRYDRLDGRPLNLPRDRADRPSEDRLIAQYESFKLAREL